MHKKYVQNARVGSDGILRIEVPLQEHDRDVRVEIVVSAGDESVAQSGIRWPKPGSWNSRIQPGIKVEGPMVAQTLIEDRR